MGSVDKREKGRERKGERNIIENKKYEEIKRNIESEKKNDSNKRNLYLFLVYFFNTFFIFK